jgi:hypothetical protein
MGQQQPLAGQPLTGQQPFMGQQQPLMGQQHAGISQPFTGQQLQGQHIPAGQHISGTHATALPVGAAPGGEPKGKLHQAIDKVKYKTKKAAHAGKRKGQKGKLQHDIDACNRAIASIKQDLGPTLYALLDVNDIDNAMVRFREAKTRILQQQERMLAHQKELDALVRDIPLERLEGGALPKHQMEGGTYKQENYRYPVNA